MAKIKTDIPADANANSAPAAIEEVQPQRGGSFVRNTDGTLTQTEGPKHQPDPDVAPEPAVNPPQTTQE